jgi:4-hydroxybenzoate polyprenyltransferase
MREFQAAANLFFPPSLGHPFAQTIRLCLVEARPCVLGIFLLRFLTGAALVVPAARQASSVRFLAAALVCQFAIFFVYLFNGVMDVREDRVNGSCRPIAHGDLCPRAAASVAFAAAALALGGGLALGSPTSWTVPAALLLGYGYSGPPWYLKRSPTGTSLVVMLSGLLTYYTGFAVSSGGWVHPGRALPIVAVVMSLWMGLVGAPAKDLSDIAGDAVAGRRGTAVVHGAARARLQVAAGAVGLAVAFLTLAVAAAPLLLPAAAVLLAGSTAVAILSLDRLSHGSRSRCRRPYRAFMTTQYVVHLTVALPELV